jgi:hypothetical protein
MKRAMIRAECHTRQVALRSMRRASRASPESARPADPFALVELHEKLQLLRERSTIIPAATFFTHGVIPGSSHIQALESARPGIDEAALRRSCNHWRATMEHYVGLDESLKQPDSGHVAFGYLCAT